MENRPRSRDFNGTQTTVKTKEKQESNQKKNDKNSLIGKIVKKEEIVKLRKQGKLDGLQVTNLGEGEVIIGKKPA